MMRLLSVGTGIKVMYGYVDLQRLEYESIRCYDPGSMHIRISCQEYVQEE